MHHDGSKTVDPIHPYLTWARSMDIDTPMQREEEEKERIEMEWDKVARLYEERNARVVYDPRRSVVFTEDERGLLKHRPGFQAPRGIGTGYGYPDLPRELMSIIVGSIPDPAERIRTTAIDKAHRSMTKSLREVVKDAIALMHPRGLPTSPEEIVGSRSLADIISESLKDLGIPFGVFATNEDEDDLEIGQGTVIVHWGNRIGRSYIKYRGTAMLLRPDEMDTGWEDWIHEEQIQLDYDVDEEGGGAIRIYNNRYGRTLQSYPTDFWRHHPLMKELIRVVGQETGYFGTIEDWTEASHARYLRAMKEK